MIKIKDKGELWGFLPLIDDWVIQYEDGSRVPLSTDMVYIDFWAKYKGKGLNEVSDVKDLNWLAKVAGEKDEQFAAMMFNMRLKELE